MNEAKIAKAALTNGEGFHVLERLIEPDKANSVRYFVLGHLDQGQVNSPSHIKLTNPLVRDPMFESLVINSRLLAVAHELLGADAKLASFSAKTLMPEMHL